MIFQNNNTSIMMTIFQKQNNRIKIRIDEEAKFDISNKYPKKMMIEPT